MLEHPNLKDDTTVALDLSEQEEAERVSELHQRETLLLNMGVVNQVRQLLQSANHPSEPINHSHEQARFSSHCRHDHKVPQSVSKSHHITWIMLVNIACAFLQLDPFAEMSWRQKNICTMMQQQVSTKAKPSLQSAHSQLVQNRKPWPSLEQGRLQPVHTEAGALKHCTAEMSASNEERRPSACLTKPASAQRLPWTSEYVSFKIFEVL